MKTIKVMRDGRPATQEELECAVDGKPLPSLPEVERFPLEDVAESFNELHRKLLTGDELPPRPFWLEIGNYGYEITDANRDSIALGMLLCLDVRGHLGR